MILCAGKTVNAGSDRTRTRRKVSDRLGKWWVVAWERGKQEQPRINALTEQICLKDKLLAEYGILLAGEQLLSDADYVGVIL